MPSTFEAEIPPLEAPCPVCTVCLNETYWEDGYFVCEHCGLCWPDRFGGDRGSRLNDEPPCLAVSDEPVDPRYINGFLLTHGLCSLPAGHEGEHWHNPRLVASDA